jgi:hypothetical protein
MKKILNICLWLLFNALAHAADLSALPEENLITFESGDGSNVQYMIADPMCETCQLTEFRLFDTTTGKLTQQNMTLHILPVALPKHKKEGDDNIIANIYCSEHPQEAWHKVLTDNEYRMSLVKLKDGCQTHLEKVDANNHFYREQGISGTPHFFSRNND